MHTLIQSPIGDLTLVGKGGQLTGLYFPHHWHKPDVRTFGERTDGVDDAAAQLGEYFAGHRTAFDLPLKPGGEDFQQQVWALISDIPYGETMSYGDLAKRIGDRSLAREVGVAVGRNPLSVLIPCHRVIGKDGALIGYAGGLKRKRFLLDLEAARADVKSKSGRQATLF